MDVNNTDNAGQTLLQEAIRHNSLNYWLNAGYDLNHRDHDGNTSSASKWIVFDYKLSAAIRHID